MLVGGSVRDVLIGGMGSDRLVANGGQDLLIGDATTYSIDYISDPLGNNSALLEVLEEWNSADDIAVRRAHLAGAPGGLNDGFFLQLGGSPTLIEDATDDVLTGSSDEDWYLLLGGDTATDLKTQKGGFQNF